MNPYLSFPNGDCKAAFDHYQQVFVYAQLPGRQAWLALAVLAALGLALLWLGWRVYQQRAPEMADEL